MTLRIQSKERNQNNKGKTENSSIYSFGIYCWVQSFSEFAWRSFCSFFVFFGSFMGVINIAFLWHVFLYVFDYVFSLLLIIFFGSQWTGLQFKNKDFFSFKTFLIRLCYAMLMCSKECRGRYGFIIGIPKTLITLNVLSWSRKVIFVLETLRKVEESLRWNQTITPKTKSMIRGVLTIKPLITLIKLFSVPKFVRKV